MFKPGTKTWIHNHCCGAICEQPEYAKEFRVLHAEHLSHIGETVKCKVCSITWGDGEALSLIEVGRYGFHVSICDQAVLKNVSISIKKEKEEAKRKSTGGWTEFPSSSSKPSTSASWGRSNTSREPTTDFSGSTGWAQPKDRNSSSAKKESKAEATQTVESKTAVTKDSETQTEDTDRPIVLQWPTREVACQTKSYPKRAYKRRVTLRRKKGNSCEELDSGYRSAASA
mgnify:CR=1 FL=1